MTCVKGRPGRVTVRLSFSVRRKMTLKRATNALSQVRVRMYRHVGKKEGKNKGREREMGGADGVREKDSYINRAQAY